MKLSLATRIFLGYAVVLVTFGAVSLFSVAELYRSRVLIQLISQGYLQLSQEAAALENLHTNQQRDTERLLKEESARARRDLMDLARLYFPPLIAQRLEAAQAQARGLVPNAPAGEVAFVEGLAERFARLSTASRGTSEATDAVFALLSGERASREAVVVATTDLRTRHAAMSREFLLVQRELESRIRARVDEAEERTRRTGLAIIALSLFAITVALVAAALSARALRPIRTLIEGVSRIGRGDYEAQLGVKGEDEVAVLAREFDAMARSLQAREAQLKSHEQLAAVGRISAQIAHEVRNPLSSIGLNVELLEEALSRASFSGASEASEARDLVAAVTREVDRLTEVTEQYLKMSRPREPTLQAEDLRELVDGVLDFSREELERARVQVVRRYAAAQALPQVLVDEAQLRQVLLNLLRNSREAMPEGGTLTIDAAEVDGRVEVRVQDTGRGMSEDVRRRVFEPFFSTKKNGTGLGLAVSQQILAAQGGSLGCVSTQGEGTTFVVTLQRA